MISGNEFGRDEMARGRGGACLSKEKPDKGFKHRIKVATDATELI